MPKKKTGAISRSEFVRQNKDKTTAEIISAGKKLGLKIRPNLVHNVRHTDKVKRTKRRQRKIVPASANHAAHMEAHRNALIPAEHSPEFEQLQLAIADFMLGVVQGIREVVRAEIRAHFSKLI